MGDSKEGTFGQSGSTRFPQDHRTMAQASMITQMQIRNNATEMQSFLTDLHDWQDDIKVKDQKLKNGEVSDGPGFYELLDDRKPNKSQHRRGSGKRMRKGWQSAMRSRKLKL